MLHQESTGLRTAPRPHLQPMTLLLLGSQIEDFWKWRGKRQSSYKRGVHRPISDLLTGNVGYSMAWQRNHDMVMVCPYIMTWCDGDGIMTWWSWWPWQTCMPYIWQVANWYDHDVRLIYLAWSCKHWTSCSLDSRPDLIAGLTGLSILKLSML